MRGTDEASGNFGAQPSIDETGDQAAVTLNGSDAGATILSTSQGLSTPVTAAPAPDNSPGDEPPLRPLITARVVPTAQTIAQRLSTLNTQVPVIETSNQGVRNLAMASAGRVPLSSEFLRIFGDPDRDGRNIQDTAMNAFYRTPYGRETARLEALSRRMDELEDLTSQITRSIGDFERLRMTTVAYERMMAESREREGATSRSTGDAVDLAYQRIRERAARNTGGSPRAVEASSEGEPSSSQAGPSSVTSIPGPSSIRNGPAASTPNGEASRMAVVTASERANILRELTSLRSRMEELRQASDSLRAGARSLADRTMRSAASAQDDGMTTRGRRLLARQGSDTGTDSQASTSNTRRSASPDFQAVLDAVDVSLAAIRRSSERFLTPSARLASLLPAGLRHALPPLPPSNFSSTNTGTADDPFTTTRTIVPTSDPSTSTPRMTTSVQVMRRPQRESIPGLRVPSPPTPPLSIAPPNVSADQSIQWSTAAATPPTDVPSLEPVPISIPVVVPASPLGGASSGAATTTTRSTEEERIAVRRRLDGAGRFARGLRHDATLLWRGSPEAPTIRDSASPPPAPIMGNAYPAWRQVVREPREPGPAFSRTVVHDPIFPPGRPSPMSRAHTRRTEWLRQDPNGDEVISDDDADWIRQQEERLRSRLTSRSTADLTDPHDYLSFMTRRLADGDHRSSLDDADKIQSEAASSSRSSGSTSSPGSDSGRAINLPVSTEPFTPNPLPLPLSSMVPSDELRETSPPRWMQRASRSKTARRPTVAPKGTRPVENRKFHDPTGR